MSEPITIRPFQPGDEASLLAGHNKTFTPPRSLAHWQWKFRDNPTGCMHTMLAVHETDGVVGAYVTLPVRVRVDGTELIAGQCVDLFVLPEHRRHGPRPGLFVNLALAHYQEWGGKRPGQNAFHYGWPIATWRIGQRYLRYEMIRDWDFLFHAAPPGGFPLRSAPANLLVQPISSCGSDHDALWQSLCDQSRLQLVRDARYLNWRYASAQDAQYELFECRERNSGRLRGLAVATQRDLLFPKSYFLVDWLLPEDDLDATVALLQYAEQRANQLAAPVVATLFQHLDPRFLHFQNLGCKVYGSSYFQVVIPFSLDDSYLFKDHWYHTLGDADIL